MLMFGPPLWRSRVGGVAILTEGLVSLYDESGVSAAGWTDDAGSNDLAAAGDGITTGTTPSGKSCVILPSVAHMTCVSPTGLPVGAEARTLYSVQAFDPSGAPLTGGFGYGNGSANQAFIMGRRGRELLLNGWSAGNDKWSEHAIIPAQWVVVSVRLAANGDWWMYVNGVEIASGNHTFATVASKIVLGGAFGGPAGSSTPLKAAFGAIYAGTHDEADHAYMCALLADRYFDGQSYATLASPSLLDFEVDTIGDTFDLAPQFSGGRGAVAITTGALPANVTFNRLILTASDIPDEDNITVTYTDVTEATSATTVAVIDGIGGPRASNFAFTVVEGQSATLDILAHVEKDDPGDELTIVSVSADVGTATNLETFATYDAPLGETAATVSFTVEDQLGRTTDGVATGTITAAAAFGIVGVQDGVLVYEDAFTNTLDTTIFEAPVVGYLGPATQLAANSRGNGPQIVRDGYFLSAGTAPGDNLVFHPPIVDHQGALVVSNVVFSNVTDVSGYTMKRGTAGTTPSYSADYADDNGSLLGHTVNADEETSSAIDLPPAAVLANGAQLTLNAPVASPAYFFGALSILVPALPPSNEILFQFGRTTSERLQCRLGSGGGLTMFLDLNNAGVVDISAITLSATAGQRIQWLFAYIDHGDGTGEFKHASRVGTVGSMGSYAQASVDIPANIQPFPFDELMLDAFWNGANTNTDFGRVSHGFAIFPGDGFDPHNSAHRQNFFAADGSVLNGSVSWGAYGQPIVDTRLNAAGLNAGTNPGTAGDWDTVSATSFTDYTP